MKDAYSPLKGLRHLDVIESVRHGLPARPVHVQLIISDVCNQSCEFCSYRDPHYTSSQLFYQIEPPDSKRGLRRDKDHPERNYNPNRMIATDKAIEILEDCKSLGVEAIQFTGGGEPTVHPDFANVLRHAQELGLKTALVSNGVLVAKRKLAPLVARCSWVRISLDAGTPETYAEMRHVPASQFDDALQSIRQINAARKLIGTECVLGVGFVVNPQNWAEVYWATEQARSAGADNIRISAQFSAEDEALFSGFHGDASDLCRRAEELATDTFQVYNRFGQKLDDLKQKSPDYDLCGYQHFTTYIGADLNVYRCCVLAYNERGVVGSLKEQRFRDLWMSRGRAQAMAQFRARDCDRCMFNGINRVLDYALRSDDPIHSEFV